MRTTRVASVDELSSRTRLIRLLPGTFCAALVLCVGALSVRADQVEMRNGDRYVGKVTSMDDEALVIQSEVLGKIRLARGQVQSVRLGEASAEAKTAQPAPHPAKEAAGQPTVANSAAVTPVSSNATAQVTPALPLAGINSNLVQQVQKRFLSNADPEAQKQFNQLVSGLLSGSLSVEDVRAQARSMAEQIRAARKDLDQESGWMIDTYLAILDRFVRETNTAAK